MPRPSLAAPPERPITAVQTTIAGVYYEVAKSDADGVVPAPQVQSRAAQGSWDSRWGLCLVGLRGMGLQSRGHRGSSLLLGCRWGSLGTGGRAVPAPALLDMAGCTGGPSPRYGLV